MNTDQTRKKQKFLRILCNFCLEPQQKPKILRILCNFCLEPQQPYGFYFERYNWKVLLKLAIFQ